MTALALGLSTAHRLRIAGAERMLHSPLQSYFQRPSTSWVFNDAGELVEVPADTLAFAHDWKTGQRLGWPFYQALTNRAPNSDMSGYTLGAIGSGGAVPAGVFVARGNTNWCNVEIVATGSAFGRAFVRVRFHGTNTTGAVSNPELRFTPAAAVGGANTLASGGLFVRAHAVVTAPNQARVVVAERTGAGAFVGQGTAVDVPLSVGAWNRVSGVHTVASAANFAALGLLMNVLAGASVDVTVDVMLPDVLHGVDLSNDPNRPVIVTTSQTPVTVAAHDWAIPHAVSGVPGNAPLWFVAVGRGSRRPADMFPRLLEINDGGNQERVAIQMQATPDERAVINVSTGGVAQAARIRTLAANRIGVMAAYVAANNVRMTLDGEAPVADTTATMPATTQMQIGQGPGSFNWLNGHVAWLAVGAGLPPGSGAGSNAEIDAALLKLSRDAYRAVFGGSTAYQSVPADLVGHV